MRPIWATAVGLLLALFYIIDTLDHRRQERHDPRATLISKSEISNPQISNTHHLTPDPGPQVQILGIHNFLFILIIIAAVFQKGFFEILSQIHHTDLTPSLYISLITCREVLMILAALTSLRMTARLIYHHNHFSFAPIREVAILFAGIFATMIPAIQYMQANAASVPLRSPGHFYFASGTLSSILDNAPTYKTFLETRLGELNSADITEARSILGQLAKSQTTDLPRDLPSGPVKNALEATIKYHPDDVLAGAVTDEELQVSFLLGAPSLNLFVLAISAGSVFFGACTYIGNGPNFMVKSIADAAGLKTPSFFTYIWKYTLPILIPIYMLIWLIFFARH
jgi:Na+/H+ antiporter NhaD/arsenite permease-like protein